MKLCYRVIRVDPQEAAITVRYFTELLSEADLRTDPEDRNDPPLRCRTDTNLTLYDPRLSEEDLHLLILRAANPQWLLLQERIKAGEVADVPAVANLVGKTFSRPVLPSGEVDLSDEL